VRPADDFFVLALKAAWGEEAANLEQKRATPAEKVSLANSARLTDVVEHRSKVMIGN
jgi:hypothetical protein